jgi:hypothetical protein
MSNIYATGSGFITEEELEDGITILPDEDSEEELEVAEEVIK